jgi:hypothetical protein
MRELTEDEFNKEFTLIPIPAEGDTKTQSNQDSQVWEMNQIQDLLPGVEANHIWSWADGEDGGEYLIAGVHHVNVYGFAVTQEIHDFHIQVEMDSEREPDDFDWDENEGKEEG